jgi:putative MATE family efflux protein
MDNKKSLLLGEMPVGKLIWKMSMPSMIGILSYNLYNIVDTIYISRGISAYAAGGLAITFPLFILLSAVSNTVGAGAASVVSRALGRKDMETAGRAAANSFGFFWAVALLITVFGLIFLEELLYAMGVTEGLMPYAKGYTRIILLGAATSTGFSSLMRAEGNSKYAMYQWVIPVTVNILLDPVFIFVFHMGVEGAAISTVASQCISVFMSLYFFFLSGKSHLNIKLRHFLPDFKVLGEVISIGFPSFAQLAGNSLTIIIINNVLRHYGGDLTISTYGIVSKITAFLLIPLQGIIQGIQPIIGYNYGAGEKQRVREALGKSSVAAACYGILVSGALFVISGELMYLFNSDTQIIRTGGNILRITCLGTAFTGVYMIQTAFFQSIGKPGISLILSLCRYILFFIPVMMLLASFCGLDGVWLSFPISAIIALGASSACMIYRGRDR